MATPTPNAAQTIKAIVLFEKGHTHRDTTEEYRESEADRFRASTPRSLLTCWPLRVCSLQIPMATLQFGRFPVWTRSSNRS